LNRVCKEHGVKLIQDAAHAFGATYNNKHVCHFADFTCYSLQAIKHITCGDGGVLVCNDEEDFKRAKRLKWFGIDREATKDAKGEWKGQRWEVDIVEAGYKYHMNNISAAIGLSQIPHIPFIVGQHQTNGLIYEDSFHDNPLIQTLKYEGLPAFWVYTLMLDKDLNRDAILESLNRAGIGAGVVHIPNHGYTCFRPSQTELPETEYFSKHQISLPCGWWLSATDVKYIAQTLETVIKEQVTAK
jgi:dTDP-4-amino-4,6-dideoxygalactose transaminase